MFDYQLALLTWLIFAGSNVVGAISGDAPSILKVCPADSAALDHSKAYYRSPISLVEPSVLWLFCFAGVVVANTVDRDRGGFGRIVDLSWLAVVGVFGGLGLYLCRKAKSRMIRRFMKRFESEKPGDDRAIEDAN